MIEKLFEGTVYVDFPSFEVAIFSVLLSFVLSTVIALTYQFTYRGNNFPNYFFQAIVLSGIVTSMIIMAVGSNLAAGFGIIGAVAIIRFRNIIRNPRNIIFMFAGISVGIATGAYGYSIAIAGVILFCSVAFLLYYSPYGNLLRMEYIVILIFEKLDVEEDDLFDSLCRRYTLQNQRKTMEGLLRSEYIVSLKDQISNKDLFEHLKSFSAIKEIRMEEKEEVVRL